MTIVEDKQALRRVVRRRITSLAEGALRQAGIDIANHLAAALPPTGVVALFASRPTEVDTGPLDAIVRARGLSRVVPRIEGEMLMFAMVDDDVAIGDLPKDRFGIPTPSSTATTVSLSACALVCVPGLAFDRRGGRLGFGRGFYDRALGAVDDDRIVGVLCSEQWVDAVPMAPHDRRIWQVVDEVGWHCRERGPDDANHDSTHDG